MRDVLQVKALANCEPEIGRWLWAMEEVRRRTIRLASDLDQRSIDWRGPDGEENSIGSLLYHIGLVETSWLFVDILRQDFPPSVQADFPFAMVGGDRRLTNVTSVPVTEHLRRLDRSREVFLSNARGLSLDEWRRLRSPDDADYEVTPEWAIFHLVEHEAGHAFQISALRKRAQRFFERGA